MKFTIITLSCLMAVIVISQAAPNRKQPMLFKYGNKVAKKIGSYARPLLAGTEDTTAKVTRDVQYGSLSAVKMAIESLIYTNRMVNNILHYVNNTKMLRNVRSPISKFSSAT